MTTWHDMTLYDIVSHTSSVCLCTDASTTQLLGTWWTTVRQSLKSAIADVYVMPTVMRSPYHDTGSVPTDVGRFLLLARLSGTLCLKTCGIRNGTVTDSGWRRFYFRSTSVFRALEVSYDKFLHTQTDLRIETSHWEKLFYPKKFYPNTLLRHVKLCLFVSPCCCITVLLYHRFAVREWRLCACFKVWNMLTLPKNAA